MSENEKARSRGASVPNKSDFVRSLPVTLTAPEVVAKAKAAGISLSPALVYAVRGSANARSGKKTAAPKGSGKGASPAPFGAHRRGPGRPAKAASAPMTANSERDFVKLVLDVGLRRAEELLHGVRARVAALI